MCRAGDVVFIRHNVKVVWDRLVGEFEVSVVKVHGFNHDLATDLLINGGLGINDAEAKTQCGRKKELIRSATHKLSSHELCLALVALTPSSLSAGTHPLAGLMAASVTRHIGCLGNRTRIEQKSKVWQ